MGGEEISQQRISDGGIGHVHQPLGGDPHQQREGPAGFHRGIEDTQQKPQPQQIPHLPRRGVGRHQPGDGQKGIHQQHDMEIVQVLLMAEEDHFLGRLDKPRRSQRPPKDQVEHLVAHRPEQQCRQQSGKIFRVQLPQRQRPVRAQQQRAAGHQK